MGCKRVTRPFCIERALRFEGKENKASKTHGSKLLILLRGKVFRSDVLMNLGYFMQQHRVNVVANMCQLNASACSLLNLRSPDCRLRFWKNNPMTTWSVIRTHWIFQRKEAGFGWMHTGYNVFNTLCFALICNIFDRTSLNLLNYIGLTNQDDFSFVLKSQIMESVHSPNFFCPSEQY